MWTLKPCGWVFLHSITLKSTALPYTLNGSLTHEWLCKIIHWSFRKYPFTTNNSGFLWSDRFTLYLLGEMCAKYPSLNNWSLTLIPSSIYGVPWKKQFVQLATQTINRTSAFPWNTIILHTLLITQILKICTLRGLRFSKVNNLCYINENNRKGSWHFLLLWLCGSEDYNIN